VTPHFSFPMSLKNARTLGIRLDKADTDRLHKFESETTIDGVSLARAALKAALNYYEQTGSISLPLYITIKNPAKATLPLNEFPVTKPPTVISSQPAGRLNYDISK